MSRLTDLIAQAKAKDPALGQELEREFKVLSARRSFGLNFERHRPESVELPGRPIRKGDKVRILPPRGETKRGDQRLWKVLKLVRDDKARFAELEEIGAADPEIEKAPVDDLVVVAEFKDYIYPGLVSTGKVERGGDKPFHTVINGENFHALEALTFTHRGKIDVIYIDPPYNTGARDWKYNNDYVAGDDLYRHSKWLAFMERRLKLVRELLNPENSALIVTIDEKEVLRLGLLLEQLFADATVQMITSLIKPSGSQRSGEFSRVEEYIFFVMFGAATPSSHTSDMLRDTEVAAKKLADVTWHGLRRRGSTDWRRSHRPNGFYPIHIDSGSGRISSVGDPVPLDFDRSDYVPPPGTFAVWPLNPDGEDSRWQISPQRLREQLSQGTAALREADRASGAGSIVYLKSGDVDRIEKGLVRVVGRQEDGRLLTEAGDTAVRRAKTMWTVKSHDASAHGTALLNRFVPARKFPFPKSLYAVEDCIRFFVSEKRDALVLDFFSGSGTTAHAVMRLNRQDGGRRQCISITNNEVAAEEHVNLRRDGFRPGDAAWEEWGICEYITKPRIKASITGKTPEGSPIQGDYKFADEFPISEGFQENAEFFTLTYENPVNIAHNRAFARVAPLLWMRAGSEGDRIDLISSRGWEIADRYGVICDLDHASPFCEAIQSQSGVRIAYVVTDDDQRFQSIVRQLPTNVEPVRLYESYMNNFRFAVGR